MSIIPGVPSSVLWGILLESFPLVVLNPIPQYFCVVLKTNGIVWGLANVFKEKADLYSAYLFGFLAST